MKTSFLILTALLTALGCQAMPPLHKGTTISCTLASGGVPVTGANFYRAHPSDTSWTTAGYVAGTNGATVVIPFDANYELWTADATNTITGGPASDYAPIFTNNIPSTPTSIKVQ